MSKKTNGKTNGMSPRWAWLVSPAVLAVFLVGTLLAVTTSPARPAAAAEPGTCRGGGSPRDWGTKCGTLFVCAYQDAANGPLPTTTYTFTVTDLTSGGTKTVSVTLLGGTQNAACVSPGAYRIGTTVQVQERVPQGQQVTRIDGFGASPVQADLQTAKGTVTLGSGVSEVHFYNATTPAS